MTPTVPMRQVLRARIVGVVLLEQQQDQAVGAERAVDRLDRHRPVDGQWLQRQWKRHRAAKRQTGSSDGRAGEVGRRVMQAKAASA